ncbi:MAG: hypothetical protein KGN79_04935 [Acidobacteriota bacterium]|nr:hypothetical protein [Acidobacteriota bacterium]
MPTAQEQFDELCFYTLAHGQPEFIHQHAVDAFAAQLADESTKPITLVFALIGLYLHAEQGFTGRQVQLAHMRMAAHRKTWHKPALVKSCGTLTVADALAAAPGPARDAAIRAWATDVWAAWHERREEIIALSRSELGVG